MKKLLFIICLIASFGVWADSHTDCHEGLDNNSQVCNTYNDEGTNTENTTCRPGLLNNGVVCNTQENLDFTVKSDDNDN